MTNTALLIRAIQTTGLKLKFISEKLGICVGTLSNKINNVTEFRASEIACLSEILNLDNAQRDEIFFAQNGELHSTMQTN